MKVSTSVASRCDQSARRKGPVFIQLTLPVGGENRPIDDVLKCGNYDLLADRGIYVERVRETLFVPASGMAGSRRLQGRGGNHETTR